MLKEEGFEGFSARKVAGETGYNVASIYTYFKNLNHLENLASIYFTTAYVNELTESTKKLSDPLDIYLNMWILFAKYSFKMPDYFYNVFFDKVSQEGDMNLFQEYYAIFPEEKPKGSIIIHMIEMAKTKDREAYVMNMSVEAGILDEEYARFIQDTHMGYFKNTLSDITRECIYTASVEKYQEHMLNLIYILYHYVEKKYKKRLDKIIEFYKIERDTYENFYDHI